MRWHCARRSYCAEPMVAASMNANMKSGSVAVSVKYERPGGGGGDPGRSGVPRNKIIAIRVPAGVVAFIFLHAKLNHTVHDIDMASVSNPPANIGHRVVGRCTQTCIISTTYAKRESQRSCEEGGASHGFKVEVVSARRRRVSCKCVYPTTPASAIVMPMAFRLVTRS